MDYLSPSRIDIKILSLERQHFAVLGFYCIFCSKSIGFFRIYIKIQLRVWILMYFKKFKIIFHLCVNAERWLEAVLQGSLQETRCLNSQKLVLKERSVSGMRTSLENCMNFMPSSSDQVPRQLHKILLKRKH